MAEVIILLALCQMAIVSVPVNFGVVYKPSHRLNGYLMEILLHLPVTSCFREVGRGFAQSGSGLGNGLRDNQTVILNERCLFD